MKCLLTFLDYGYKSQINQKFGEIKSFISRIIISVAEWRLKFIRKVMINFQYLIKIHKEIF